MAHRGQRLGTLHPLELGEVHQLLPDGLFRVQPSLLGEVAQRHLAVVDGLPIQENFSAILREDVHENADGGGLTGAVSAQQAEGLASLSGEGDALEHLLGSKALFNVA